LPCSPEVLDPATVCVASLPLPGVTSLSLSADQLLLACVTGTAVQVYSLPHLLHHQSDAPVASLDLGRDLVQFAWCPDAAGRDSACSYLALTSDRVLLHGSLMSGNAALADRVECAAWSPDGQHIAYSSASRLVVTAPDWKDSAFTVNIPAPEGEGEECGAVREQCEARKQVPCLTL
jgi:WD40 repeat protein